MNAIRRRAGITAPACAVAASFALLACGDEAGPVDGAKAFAHADAICAFGPRPPGSPALRQAADYIAAELAKIGLEAKADVWEEEHEVNGAKQKHSFRNLWTEIPGADPVAGPILLLAAHYDSKPTEGHPNPEHNFPFVGALDSAASCGLLLELARLLTQRQSVPNLWIAWFDGEECLEFDWVRDDSLSLFGSRRFVKQLAADKTRFPKGVADRLRAMVLLDLLGDHNIKIDRDTRSNEQLLEIFAEAAAEIGQADKMYRWHSPMVDDHIPFKNYGVAVIDLIDFRWRYAGDGLRTQPTAEQPVDRGPAPGPGTYTEWWHTELDTTANVSAESLAFVGNLIWHALPRIEQTFYAR